ncbi:MAG TPA: glutamate-5-semialdehyde dehydrogenase [Bacillota bacterium]|nr:glutamate-5-semialdehyde dehydrogenase [Bacillota bacterium]
MLDQELETKGKAAKEAAYKLANLGTDLKNRALLAMAEALVNEQQVILAANRADLENGEAKGLSKAMLERLMLNEKRIADMAEGLKQVAALPDPVGEVPAMWNRPNGLQIGQVRVPLGVIGIVYESRPNVTVDAAALCLKSGNAVILRGGSEAIKSNLAIGSILSRVAEEQGVPAGAIQLIESTDREAVTKLLKMTQYLNVIIPRGGAGLINHVVENSSVPVIQTGVGNCHVYVDKAGNLEMAENIVINAKCQRPSVCNAMETLLVHREVAGKLLPGLAAKLLEQGVELRGCEETRKLVPQAKPATEQDYATEFSDLILAIKVVEDLDEALRHIWTYGTKHSEAIITEDYHTSRRFLKEVDAAAVYVNASTRFTDGFEFGFGAEIGISTQKLHARGPMGLKELTTIKYIIYGEGQVRG